MADNNTPPVNRFSREEARNANEITQAARSLTEELKDQLGVRSRLNETEKSTLNLARQLQNSAAQNSIELGNQGAIERQIAKDVKTRLAIERELNDLTEGANKASEISLDNANRITKLTEEISKLEKIREGRTGAIADRINDAIARREAELYSTKLIRDTDAQRIALLNQMASVNDEVIRQRKEEANLQKQINDNMGATGAIVKGTGALMERLGMRSGIFQDAMKESAEAMRNMAEQNVRNNAGFSKTRIMLTGFSKLAKGFGKALMDPLTVLFAIADAFFTINKLAVETTRLTGQDATSGIVEFGKGAASAADRMEVLNELTKDLGKNAQNIFSEETLQGAANLKVEMGLAAKEAGNIAIMAQTSGTSVDDLTDKIVKTTSEFNGANRTAVSQGVILRDIGNVSEGIRASFTGSTTALIKSAAAARRLGMSIEDLDKIAESLLDFESSISNELEAQLLTGKNINMAKARELALSNDLEGLGKEILKNSSDIHEFGRMNRIQQNSYAKSLGLTRDQLARIAYQRALDLKMSHEQAAAAANVNAENMKSITVQENFKKALEKIAMVLTPMLEKIGKFLSIPIVGQLVIGGLIAVKVFTSLWSMLGKILTVKKAITAATRQDTIANNLNAQSQTAAGGSGAAGSSTRGLTSMTTAVSRINMGKVLQGAAALAIVAGSLYVFGKAVQQFSEVSWGDVGKAVVGMFALVGAVAALGAIMMSGVGAVAILAGAAAMLVMGGAVMVLGLGVQMLADGFNSMIPNLMGLTKMIPELFQVADALDSIGNGLIKVAAAGILAIPALMVVSELSETQAAQNNDGLAKLEAKMDRLIAVVESGGNVYLDGNKVGTAQVLGTYKSS